MGTTTGGTIGNAGGAGTIGTTGTGGVSGTGGSKCATDRNAKRIGYDAFRPAMVGVALIGLLQMLQSAPAPAPGGGLSSKPGGSVPAHGDDCGPQEHDCVHEERAWIHWLGARYDLGRASAYGIGYDVGRLLTRSGYPDLFYAGRLSLGLEAYAVTRSHDRIDAMVFLVAARSTAVVGAGGFGFELRGGIADPRQGEAPGLMALGLFWSYLLVELGYSYEFPLAANRPDWMSSHQFSLRVHIPVWRHGLVSTNHRWH